MKEILIEKTANSASTLGHIGSVLDVLAAHLPKEVTAKRFKAADYAYGFELGTPRSIKSIGETVIVNGTCYATSSEKGSKDYNKTIHGSEFTTGGLFLIPHEAKPSYRASLAHSDSALPLIECYNHIYQTIQEPLAFVGLIEFSNFHGSAIGKPPIDGQAIFEHKKDYYPCSDSMVRRKNVSGFVIGAITDYKDKRFETLNRQLEVVLYNNPEEKSAQITYHAHVLTLKKSLKTVQEVTPSVVDQTLHLYCEESSVQSFQLDIFTIKNLKDYL